MEAPDHETPRSTPFSCILACLALSPRGAAVVSEAQRLSLRSGARLVLLHVGEDGEDTRLAVNATIEAAGLPLEGTEVLIRDGKVDDVVCAAANEIAADLIIAGALEKEGAIEYYIGSVARKIARTASQSVLLLTDPKVNAAPLRSIGVAIDLDDDSRETLSLAIAIARAEQDATLHVLHEYEAPALRMGLDDGLDIREEEETQDAVESEEHSRLLSFADAFDFSGVTTELFCLRGRKGWEATEYARTRDLDLLIAEAPQRRLGLFDKLFQHDVEYALQSLPCAFLLFRSPEERADD